jgi:hypothetical protein
VDLTAHKDGQEIIMELKYKDNDSRGAQKQIFTKGYYKIFRNEKLYDKKDNIKFWLAMGGRGELSPRTAQVVFPRGELSPNKRRIVSHSN